MISIGRINLLFVYRGANTFQTKKHTDSNDVSFIIFIYIKLFNFYILNF